MKVVYAILKTIINTVLRLVIILLFRIKIVGKENVPKEGGYILCSNHVSNWDPLALIMFTPRKVCFMTKKEIFKFKIVYFFANIYGYFPVDRGARDIQAIKTSMEIIKNGDILGIFPEGTRNGMAKKIKIHTGATRIALKTGAKVIPVGISGDFKPFKKVTITYGKPLDLSEFVTEDKAQEKQNLENATNYIMDNIISLTKK